MTIALNKTNNKKTHQKKFPLKTVLTWHWVSSAMCLIGMILFSITGITLNHASSIEAVPTVVNKKTMLEPALIERLKIISTTATSSTLLPLDVIKQLEKKVDETLKGFSIEWSDEEIYMPMPKPGGDAWLKIDLVSGRAEYESIDRGWIAYLNDLHKGRHTGLIWQIFLDVFAGASILFCLTGLLILQFHAKNRRSTWPLVLSGLVIPAVLLLVVKYS